MGDVDGPGSDGPGFAIPDRSLRVCNPLNPRKATNQWLQSAPEFRWLGIRWSGICNPGPLFAGL